MRRALDGRCLVECALLDGDLVAVVLRGRRSRLVRLGSAAAVDAQADHLSFALRRLIRPARSAQASAAHVAGATSALERLRHLCPAPAGAGLSSSRRRGTGGCPGPI